MRFGAVEQPLLQLRQLLSAELRLASGAAGMSQRLGDVSDARPQLNRLAAATGEALYRLSGASPQQKSLSVR